MHNYHDDITALTRTHLGVFVRSRVEFYEQFITRKMPKKNPTASMEVGDIIHRVLLDGADLDASIAIYPPDVLTSNGAINHHRVAEWRATIGDKIPLKKAVAAEVAECVQSITKGEFAEVIAAATGTEHLVQAEVCGRLCKFRGDIYCEFDDRVVLYDLKVGDHDPGLFRRTARRLKYWLQDAHYSAVAEEATGKPVTFRFFRIEATYPFRVSTYWYDPASRDAARDVHRSHVREFVRCELTGDWEDEHDPILVMDAWEDSTLATEVNFND